MKMNKKAKIIAKIILPIAIQLAGITLNSENVCSGV